MRKYDDRIHTLDQVIPDLDERVSRLERAVRAMAEEPGQPHHTSEVALEILDEPTSL